MKTKHTTLIALACCALLVAAGCGEKTSTAKSELTASSGGRDLRVVAEGGAWVHPEETRFVVKVKGHELELGQERLLIDKKEAAKIPAGAKKFAVTFEAGTLTVTADGAPPSRRLTPSDRRKCGPSLVPTSVH